MWTPMLWCKSLQDQVHTKIIEFEKDLIHSTLCLPFIYTDTRHLANIFVVLIMDTLHSPV